MRAPRGKRSRLRLWREISASRASARAGNAAKVRPSGVPDGRSLNKCPARSIRPSRSACSISVTNSPLSPMRDSARSRITSPLVWMISKSTCRPGWAARSRPATNSVCFKASWLPRVPIVSRSRAMRTPVQPEQELERLGVRLGIPLRGLVFQPHGRLVQQLVDDARDHRLDDLAAALVEAGQAPERLFELIAADRVG